MVLQQNKTVPVWGVAQPGELISVKIGRQIKRTIANKNGKWQILLEPVPIGKTYEMVISGKNTIRLTNVAVGEVWVCSGQSNMSWPLNRSRGGSRFIKDSKNYPGLRRFDVVRTIHKKPQEDVKGIWYQGKKKIWRFSAVCYHFGLKLHKKLRVPVGLIHASWGGTGAAAWTPMRILKSQRAFYPILARQKKWEKRGYKIGRWRYWKRYRRWRRAVKRARRRGRRIPRRPRRYRKRWHNNSPSALYNGMIHPLIPFAIRGVAWYQGESNVPRAYQYRKLFPALIKSWRARWGQGNFPFIFVQLPPYRYRGLKTSAYNELVEAQTMTLMRVKNTAMAITNDLGSLYNLHFRRKHKVGKRLATTALGSVYKKRKVYSGPIYVSMKIKKNKAFVYFRHSGSGLTSKKGRRLRYFMIAGEDKRFFRAKAKVNGRNTVVVWSKRVPNPVAVRLAWRDYMRPNLFNKEGLPASSFRTDKWKGITEGKF